MSRDESAFREIPDLWQMLPTFKAPPSASRDFSGHRNSACSKLQCLSLSLRTLAIVETI